MENWMRRMSKQMALILGILAALIGISVYTQIQGMLGGGIMGACAAMAVLFIHKGVTGMTMKEKQESKSE